MYFVERLNLVKNPIVVLLCLSLRVFFSFESTKVDTESNEYITKTLHKYLNAFNLFSC